MLKIKENISLEKLEEFGFKPKYIGNTGEIIHYEKENFKNGYRLITITRDYKKMKKFWKIDEFNEYLDFDTLYDLIKAGLVEKC